MIKPKVSVIVPVYNTEQYLVRCLESLVNQTLQEIEILIVDDGSTDTSPQIIADFCNAYPDKLISYTQPNSGQAVARNKALKLCRGEYVGFLDSDDFVKESMFKKMYEAAVQKDADYVACGYTDTTYRDGKLVELKHYVASKAADSPKDMFFGALVSPFIHLYRREILIKTDIMFPQGKIYEDTAFYLELIPYIKKIAVIEEPLCYRVRRRNSTTTSFTQEKVDQIFSVFDETLEYYHDHQLWEEYKEELTYFCVKVLLCSSMRRICKIPDKKARKELICKTLAFLENNFSGYQNNIYIKRKSFLNIYFRSYNRHTAGFYSTMFILKGKMERQYT